MKRIVLINMPNARLDAPSLALTQLSGVITTQFGGRCTTEVLYLNLDFAAYLAGPSHGEGDGRLYNHFLGSTNTGLGDWFFRQAAFPDQSDNTAEYFQRYFPQRDEETT